MWIVALSLLSDLNIVESYAQGLSALAVIVGAIFVFFQLRQNNKLIQATARQAEAAIAQGKLTNDQMQLTNQIANIDIVMRLYEFANTAELQTSWLTVLHSNVHTLQEWENLPKEDQVAFYQIAALFESLGVLVQRNIVSLDVIDDTFQVELAWQKLESFTKQMREQFGEEAAYVAFENLYKKMKSLHSSPLA